MAVIQYSALVTQLRGKLGGSQFNKGHAGYTLQRKSTPTIRQTPAQLAQRQRVSIAQRSWKDETDQRKMQAAQSAQNNPTTDRFGQQVILSGYNHYIKIMTWRLTTAYGRAPFPLDLPIRTTSVSSARMELGNFSLTLQGPAVNGVYAFEVYADRILVGVPTGQPSRSKGYLYLTQVDSQGRRISSSRRVFFMVFSFTAGILQDYIEQLQTSMYIESGMYFLAEMYTRQIEAGAETGYWSEVIQLQ